MIEGLRINRPLDLSIQQDQHELREAALGLPMLSQLIEEHLEEYLSLFSDSQWKTIYPGGLIFVRVNRRYSTGFDLMQMLELTKALQKLRTYKGYEKLLSGFRNPTQVESTYFEVTVASWCADRAVSLSLEFSPEVEVKSRLKHPEFLWHTQMGNIYCECKSESSHENKLQQNMDKVESLLRVIYHEYKPWEPTLRLDVRFEGGTTNKIQARFRSVIAKASASMKADTYLNQVFSEGNVSAVLRHREEPIPYEDDAIQPFFMEVGTEPKSVEESNSCLSLTMSVANYRRQRVKRLLQDARTQLPSSYFGAVFIQLRGAVAARKKVQELLDGAVYENTPWVSIWVYNRRASADWRQGQPFDERLLTAKT